MRVKPSSKQLVTGYKWTEEHSQQPSSKETSVQGPRVWSAFQWPANNQHCKILLTSRTSAECLSSSAPQRKWLDVLLTVWVHHYFERIYVCGETPQCSVAHTSRLDSGSWPSTCSPTKVEGPLRKLLRKYNTLSHTHTHARLCFCTEETRRSQSSKDHFLFLFSQRERPSSTHISQIHTLSNSH